MWSGQVACMWVTKSAYGIMAIMELSGKQYRGLVGPAVQCYSSGPGIQAILYVNILAVRSRIMCTSVSYFTDIRQILTLIVLLLICSYTYV
jgi:hypothetical protein